MNVENPEASKACLVRYLDHWDTIKESRVVFRGQKYEDFQKTPLISVSTSRAAAEGFVGKNQGYVFTLYLHPGVQYLDFSKYYDAIGIVTYQHEAEFVIPGNSKFVPRKYDPRVIDVYPHLYTPYFVLLNLNNNTNNRPALLYNVRGLNKRLLKSRNTSRKNTGGPNMSAVNGGKRQQRRMSRRLRSKSQKSR